VIDHSLVTLVRKPHGVHHFLDDFGTVEASTFVRVFTRYLVSETMPVLEDFRQCAIIGNDFPVVAALKAKDCLYERADLGFQFATDVRRPSRDLGSSY
jgi:hypothetical protein